MNKHTPTPWHAEETAKGSDAIVSNHDYQIARVFVHPIDGEAEANAAHIVRCVNSHEALVKALETVKQYAGAHLYPELREFVDEALAAAGEQP